MFEMKVEKQLNMKDRTLLVGKPTYDSIPKKIKVNNHVFGVIGVSQGVKIPFISLEIEKTSIALEGKHIVA